MLCFESDCDKISGHYFECENIVLPYGVIYKLYIADSGIFAVVLPVSTYGDLYVFLRDIFGTSRIKIYVQDTGLYDYATDNTGPLLSDDELTDQINSWIFSDSPVWDDAHITELCDKMLLEAAVLRGEFVDADGNVFVLRHKKFFSASPKRSDRVFFLALFGGVLGLHRFAVGKIFSGVLFLLTGGLFLIGWLLDLISLLCGVFRDSEGKYLVPLKNRFKRLLWLPVGAVVSALIFFINSSLFSFSLNLLNEEMYNHIHSSDGFFVEKFSSGAEQFIRNIQLLTGD